MLEISMDVKRWLLPLLVGLILFGNHYVRDSLGALEKQFESELHLTAQDYSNLNALYFFPNIITPVLAGMLTERLGGVASCFLYSVLIASFGHLLFALGIQFSSKALIFIGRGIGGSMYEIVDALMPITYLGPLFEKEFQIVVGFMQIFIRMGSVVNFIVSPYIYLHANLRTAFWVASAVGMASVPLFLCARRIELEYVKYKRDNNIEGSGGSEKCVDSEEGVEMMTNSSEHNGEVSHNHHHRKVPGDSSGYSFVIESEADDEEAGIYNDIYSTGGTTVDDDSVTSDHADSISSSRSRSNNNSNSDLTAINRHASSTSVYLPPSHTKRTYLSRFLDIMPLHKFTTQFYLYLLSGSLLYGSIVPFWFIGSKYMQDRLSLSVLTADTLMTIPEGMVIVVCFPLGILVSRYKWNLQVKLGGMCVAMVGMSLSYVILVLSTVYGVTSEGGEVIATTSADGVLSSTVTLPTYSMHMPLFAVILLGLSFSFACSFFWGAVPETCSPELLSPASGLVSCGVNILPAVVPPILALFIDNSKTSSHANMVVLAVIALASAVFALLAAFPSLLVCCIGGAVNGENGGSILTSTAIGTTTTSTGSSNKKHRNGVSYEKVDSGDADEVDEVV